MGSLCADGSGVREDSGTPAASKGHADKFITVNGLRIHYLDWGANGKQPGLYHAAWHQPHREHIRWDCARLQRQLPRDRDGSARPRRLCLEPGGRLSRRRHGQGRFEGLIDQLNLQDVVLLGNSTGGRVVQVYAGKHPDRVARLIVEDVGPERPPNIANSYEREVERDANGWASEDELVASLLKTDKRTPEADQRNFVHFATKKREDGRIVWKRDPNLGKGFVVTQLWEYVSKITCPTIYILGGSSNIVPPETQIRLQMTLPKVEIVVVSNTGHYPDIEKPGDFVKIVNLFLTGSIPKTPVS